MKANCSLTMFWMFGMVAACVSLRQCRGFALILVHGALWKQTHAWGERGGGGGGLESANLKTLFDMDCSLGLVKNLSNNVRARKRERESVRVHVCPTFMTFLCWCKV